MYQYDPDPKWAPLIVDPVCNRPNEEGYDGYKVTEEGLASLKAAGHHHDSPGVKVDKVILRDRIDANQVSLYVIIEGLPGAIVDREGKIVKDRPPMAPTGFFEGWVRGPDGRWRGCRSTVLGPPGEGWETW